MSSPQHLVQAELAATPRNVSSARAVVRLALQPWPHLLDTGALLVTELATNAVLHARSTFLVELTLGADAVRIAVSDTSPVLPQRTLHGVEAGTGRGLGLVTLLSNASGCDRRADGAYVKTAWCELPLDPEALADPADGALVA